MPTTYLDANATTSCDLRVVEAMLPYFHDHAGNASSPHTPGQRARRAVEEAREEVARLINCEPDAIVFTSGGTEADNLAVFGLARAARRRDPARTRILISAVEHPAVSESARALEDSGFRVESISVDREGVIDLAVLETKLGPDVALVAVMLANNETGTIEPVEEAGLLIRKAGAAFHVDAVQAAGKIPLGFEASSAGTFAIAGHKFHGPKGIGALAIRRGARLDPLLRGGLQEKQRRPGTENVPLIVGLGVASRLALAGLAENTARMETLRDRLESKLHQSLPDAFVNGRLARRTPNTTSLTIPGISAETLVVRLDLEGIAVSTGAACSTGVVRPSATLLALGLTPREAASTVRISLHRETRTDDIDRVAELLPSLARAVREAGVTP